MQTRQKSFWFEASSLMLEEFVDFIEKQNMKCSNLDSCLLILSNNEKKLFIVIHANDGLVAGTDKSEISLFVIKLKEEF